MEIGGLYYDCSYLIEELSAKYMATNQSVRLMEIQLQQALCQIWSSAFDNVTGWELNPIAEILRVIKQEFSILRPEIFKTILAILYDYNPNFGESHRDKTVRYIRLLLASRPELADFLVHYLPPAINAYFADYNLLHCPAPDISSTNHPAAGDSAVYQQGFSSGRPSANYTAYCVTSNAADHSDLAANLVPTYGQNSSVQFSLNSTSHVAALPKTSTRLASSFERLKTVNSAIRRSATSVPSDAGNNLAANSTLGRSSADCVHGNLLATQSADDEAAEFAGNSTAHLAGNSTSPLDASSDGHSADRDNTISHISSRRTTAPKVADGDKVIHLSPNITLVVANNTSLPTTCVQPQVLHNSSGSRSLVWPIPIRPRRPQLPIASNVLSVAGATNSGPSCLPFITPGRIINPAVVRVINGKRVLVRPITCPSTRSSTVINLDGFAALETARHAAATAPIPSSIESRIPGSAPCCLPVTPEVTGFSSFVPGRGQSQLIVLDNTCCAQSEQRAGLSRPSTVPVVTYRSAPPNMPKLGRPPLRTLVQMLSASASTRPIIQPSRPSCATIQSIPLRSSESLRPCTVVNNLVGQYRTIHLPSLGYRPIAPKIGDRFAIRRSVQTPYRVGPINSVQDSPLASIQCMMKNAGASSVTLGLQDLIDLDDQNNVFELDDDTAQNVQNSRASDSRRDLQSSNSSSKSSLVAFNSIDVECIVSQPAKNATGKSASNSNARGVNRNVPAMVRQPESSTEVICLSSDHESTTTSDAVCISPSSDDVTSVNVGGEMYVIMTLDDTAENQPGSKCTLITPGPSVMVSSGAEEDEGDSTVVNSASITLSEEDFDVDVGTELPYSAEMSEREPARKRMKILGPTVLPKHFKM